MAEAAQADTTLRGDSETVATFELKQIHKQKILGAEPQLITIEAIAETMLVVATSDAFEGDDGIARSLTFLAGTLMDECAKLRGRLYDG